MAEFCKDCAYKFGMKPDCKPLLCEGCGQSFEKKSFLHWFTSLKNYLFN